MQRIKRISYVLTLIITTVSEFMNIWFRRVDGSSGRGRCACSPGDARVGTGFHGPVLGGAACGDGVAVVQAG
jgi:hypothetical protein